MGGNNLIVDIIKYSWPIKPITYDLVGNFFSDNVHLNETEDGICHGTHKGWIGIGLY